MSLRAFLARERCVRLQHLAHIQAECRIKSYSITYIPEIYKSIMKGSDSLDADFLGTDLLGAPEKLELLIAIGSQEGGTSHFAASTEMLPSGKVKICTYMIYLNGAICCERRDAVESVNACGPQFRHRAKEARLSWRDLDEEEME